ncbi:hypothetical protein AZI87_17245 [Bdellovibrio bacteriovorus]|uniref:Lipid II flippase MurJ n=1 Tax=Bdellovibrio bacteriovorus TaxID=959 RepID=A0A162FTS8_BDEBC|nr:lipid II flippase MurJ [Bdellovibrio bacteriovorus]KYG62276.1 hypothetical protein AZI87_17245 [Bdellovibrio bacteriovorus]
MKKTLIAVVILAIISKALGFSREVLLAYYFGTSPATDAFSLTSVIPLLIFGPLGSALAAAFIPLSTHAETKEAKLRLLAQLGVFYLFVSTLGLFVGLIYSREIATIIAPGASGDFFTSVHFYTRISLLAFPFVGLTSILVAFQQADDKHLSANAIGIPLSLATIAIIVTAKNTDSDMLAYATPVAYLAQAAYLLYLIAPHFHFASIKKGLWNLEVAKDALRATSVILPTLILIQSNGLIDRVIASKLPTGSISSLAYADRIITLFIGVFILSLSSIIFPKLSLNIREKNLLSFTANTEKALKLTIATSIPIAVGILFFSEEIIYLVFYRGSFDQASLDVTSSCLLLYSFGIIFIGAKEIITKAFYAMNSSIQPLIAAAVAVVTNTLLSLYLSQIMGVNGIALATSIAQAISLIYLLIVFKMKAGSFCMTGGFKVFLWPLAISLILAECTSISILQSEFISHKHLSYAVAAALYLLTTYGLVFYLDKRKILNLG